MPVPNERPDQQHGLPPNASLRSWDESTAAFRHPLSLNYFQRLRIRITGPLTEHGHATQAGLPGRRKPVHPPGPGASNLAGCSSHSALTDSISHADSFHPRAPAHPRFRITVHPSHCPPRSRVPSLLTNRSVRHLVKRTEEAGSAGHYSFWRAI